MSSLFTLNGWDVRWSHLPTKKPCGSFKYIIFPPFGQTWFFSETSLPLLCPHGLWLPPFKDSISTPDRHQWTAQSGLTIVYIKSGAKKITQKFLFTNHSKSSCLQLYESIRSWWTVLKGLWRYFSPSKEIMPEEKSIFITPPKRAKRGGWVIL